MKRSRAETFLKMAHWFKNQDPATAESYFKCALTCANSEHGHHSLLFGAVLVDYAECLELWGRNDEAERYNEEARNILILFVRANGSLLRLPVPSD